MEPFRAMRRIRQQLQDEESVGILQRATAGTLALLGDNGYPYAVPLSYVYVEGRLYFHSVSLQMMIFNQRSTPLISEV